MSEISDRLVAVQGVLSVRRTIPVDGVEDLYVATGMAECDVLIWRNERLGSSRVFISTAVADGVPDAWLEELVGHVVRGEYELEEGGVVLVTLDGTRRRLSGG